MLRLQMPRWLRDKEISKWLPFVIFLSVLCWSLVVWKFHPKHPPVGAYIAILAFGAALVTLWEPNNNRWAKAAWLLSFGALLVLEISTLYEQRSEDEGAETQRRVAENTRFTTLLHDEHEHFAGILEANARQTKEVLRTTTGGDSLCFLSVAFDKAGAAFNVLHRGKYPLSDLSMRILDNDDLPTALRLPSNIIGTLPVKGSIEIYPRRLVLPDKDEKRFTVLFTARNGSWDQFLLLRRDANKAWHFGTRVVANPGQTKFSQLNVAHWRVLYEHIDEHFPGAITLEDWDKFNGQRVYCLGCK